MDGADARKGGEDHQDNNANLWRKYKAAKERLSTRSEFFSKYGSPSAGISLGSSFNPRYSELGSADHLLLTGVTKPTPPEKPESGFDIRCPRGKSHHSSRGSGASGDLHAGSGVGGDNSLVMTDHAPSFTEKESDVFELELSKCDSPLGGATDNVTACKYPGPEELGHRAVQGELMKLGSDTDTKHLLACAAVNSGGLKSEEVISDLQQPPVPEGEAAAPELSPVTTATLSLTLSQTPDAHAISTLFPHKSATRLGYMKSDQTMPPTVETVESDDTDEIMLLPRNRTSTHHCDSTNKSGGDQDQHFDKSQSEILQGQASDGRQIPRDNPVTKADPQRVQPGNKSQVTHASAKENNTSLQTKSVNDPKATSNVAGQSSQDVLEELRRLQEEAIVQVGMNRFRDMDYPTANPEALSIVRDGPGTDPNSSVSKKIAKHRMINEFEPDLESPRTTSRGSQLQELMGERRHNAQWSLYQEDARAYPKIEGGRVVLCAEPTPGHSYIPPPVENGTPEIGLEMPPPSQDEPPYNSWTDWKYSVNWEYHPQVPAYDAFKDWFRHWLDNTMHICWYVDIYHRSFFDGTAHTDGVRSLFIPDIGDVETRLDMTDEKTRLHYHETAQGYCYNYMQHLDREQEALEKKRKRARDVYLQAAQNPPQPNPNLPKANIYLRPAEVGDIPELIELCNWYILHGTQSVDLDLFNQADMRQRIDDSKRESLPFIVAAERRNGPFSRAGDQPERILGYALATDFMGERTTGRYTAELEVFVHPQKKRQGIGRCLMDKLLEVCDPMYIPKRGYYFDSSLEERRGYYSGGRRKLDRLIFTLCYPEDNPTEYQRVKEWLGEKYQFEEQGLLKGVGQKFDKFLNISYLVRNTGNSYSAMET
ncbi:hypothetical protein VTN02DRAFT_4144 [Thermoascus thermophilus]